MVWVFPFDLRPFQYVCCFSCKCEEKQQHIRGEGSGSFLKPGAVCWGGGVCSSPGGDPEHGGIQQEVGLRNHLFFQRLLATRYNMAASLW